MSRTTTFARVPPRCPGPPSGPVVIAPCPMTTLTPSDGRSRKVRERRLDAFPGDDRGAPYPLGHVLGARERGAVGHLDVGRDEATLDRREES